MSRETRFRPVLDGLERRQVPSAVAPTHRPDAEVSSTGAGSIHASTSTSEVGQGGVATPGRALATTPAEQQATLSVLNAFAKAFLSNSHEALYNPALDTNHNGFIGIPDGKALLKTLPPLSKKIPLRLNLYLPASEHARHNIPSDSGANTYSQHITILGHTTPGALIFSDNSLGDYTFQGPVAVADANGNFSFKETNSAGINNNDFMVIDAYGDQLTQDFPVFWIPYAAKGSTL